MRVTLFRAFPDPYRQSMTVYADRLRACLGACMASGESVADYLPSGVLLRPRLLRYWSQYVRYQRLARRAQGDVNHVIDQAYAHLVHGLDGRRTVVTFHDAIGLAAAGARAASRLGRRLVVAGLHKAAAIICDSEASRRSLLQWVGCPPARIEVIPAGVDEALFDEGTGDPRARLGVGPGPTVLHVGHTGSYKNIPAVLRVLAIVGGERRQPVTLLKVGGAFTAEQEGLAQDLGVADRIIHLGLLAPDRLPEAYRAADVLLFPSLDEGFGLPPLEAMAAGLPVVASNRGALPEVVGDAGILADPEDVRGLADAVAAVLSNADLRARLVAAGHRRARLFSWEATAAKTLEVYRHVHRAPGVTAPDRGGARG